MSKNDDKAAEAVLRMLKQYAQYTYTLSIGDALKIVRCVDRTRKTSAVVKKG